METAGLLHRRPRVHSSYVCATISIAQKSINHTATCEYRLPKVSTTTGDNGRVGLQYRRAKTAGTSELYGDRRARKSSTSALPDRGQVRRSAVSLSAADNRESQGAGRQRSSSSPNQEESQTHDIPIAHRTLEERLANPDRLSFDRRGLAACPRLEGEENLRLLNLQHNSIVHLRNLSVLRKLIFLDLYDNRIERVSGLGTLRSLRVLMLGKNRITKIDGLEALEKLDVLDLHGNEIDEISNLSHLTELRVLNLAGNRIREVRGLLGMRSLTELNLRRNHIVLVDEVDRLPLLERIFLSHNEITSWVQIEAVSRSTSICELTLDGNLLSREKQYRLAAIHQMAHIRCLDMKRISDEERRLALAWSRREEEKRKELSRIATLKEKRRQALAQAKKQWEVSNANLWNRTGRVMRIPDLYSMHMNRPSTCPNEVTEHPSTEMPMSSSQMPNPANASVVEQTTETPTISVVHKGSWSRNQARTAVESVFEDLNKITDSQTQNQQLYIGNTTDSGIDSSVKTNQSSEMEFDEVDGAFLNEELEAAVDSGPERSVHVAEVVGSELILYGPGAFPALDSLYVKEIAGSITAIIFKYVQFEEIIRNLPKLRVKYPNVTSLTFTSTSISTLSQLGLLSQIRRIDNLSIDKAGNPVTSLQFWRHYLLVRMAHASIRRINGREITDSDWELARALFLNVVDLDSRRPWMDGSPREETASRVASQLATACMETCVRADSNRTSFGRVWPRMWRRLVREALETLIRRQKENAALTPDVES